MSVKKSKDNAETALLSVVQNLKQDGEIRLGQLEMLRQVDSIIHNGGCAVVKAGTGTGKSFAYLVPALLSGKKIVIATATKTLQDQLAKNDLPAVSDTLDLELSYAVLKGRSNYLCRKAFGEHIDERNPGAPKLFSYANKGFAVYEEISDWLAVTETGDLSELDIEVTADLAKEISVTVDECVGSRLCPKGDVCFAEKAKKRTEEATVIVVNLHLLCLDMVYGKILPNYDVLIVDEVHELEDVLTKTLGFTITSKRFRGAIAELQSALNEISKLRSSGDSRTKDFFSKMGYQETYLDALFATVSEELPESVAGIDDYLEMLSGRRILYGEPSKAETAFLAHLDIMADKVQFILDLLTKYLAHFSYLSSTKDREEEEEFLSEKPVQRSVNLTGKAPLPDKTIRAVQVVTKLLADMHHILAKDANFVIYAEREAGFLKLEGMPLDLSLFLDKGTFTNKPTVMTSATVDGAIVSRLGADGDLVSFTEVQSPFDYHSNSLLYIPSHLPDPRKKDMSTYRYSEIATLLKAFNGKALVLFTSKAAMEEAYEFCLRKVSTNLIMQGRHSRRFLIDKFTAERDTSLFATMSFWQGVDVPGESLSLVIIDKIPFPRPDDPLLMARRELAGEAGFVSIDLPKAANLLAQGVGRLIRSSTDKGVVAVLDPRLNTAKYKNYLISRLPAMPVTTDYKEVLSYLSTLALNDN